MSSEFVIETRGLTKVYKVGDSEIWAANDINIAVDRGEILSIMGPSGSGKSTLLNLIGCIDRPTKGTVFVEGTDVSKLAEQDLNRLRLMKIGFVFQTFNLLPTLNALENVELPMVLAGKPRGERVKRAEELIYMVGLSERLRHMPNQLSVGERQRVGIARALANDPPIILADEPTGNLDSKTAEEIIGIFRRVNKEYEKTIVIVTHNIKVAEQTERILTLKDGRVQEETLRGSSVI